MAVKIRLTRLGKKKQPVYRVVVMDSRKARDGRYIEQIGRYAPLEDPSVVEIDNEAALKWLHNGAQPTERVQKLLEISGAWTQFRVDKGDIHTIGEVPTAKVETEPEPVVEAAPEAAVVEAAPEAAVDEPTADADDETDGGS
ncbi:SSU ribosomal protein S16p [hydrothermal vent metagenome]|uniref:SSU ribosomal protein S16p n=1 Tax=hydrothermal vent metagenome TaxID=652676 RepID=A0A3B0T932_9ZZZZ